MRVRFLILLAAACVCTCPFAFADTTWVAGGDVSGLWTHDGSPYMILDAVYVPPGAVLSISPGVTVFFTTRCYLVVDSGARIEAVGAPGDSIYFTTDTLLVPDGWESIPLIGATDTCRFEYCVFEFAREPGFGGVFWSVHCPLILHGCNFRNNSTPTGWAGVASLEYTWVRFSECVFESNYSRQGGVFTIEETRGSIENCVFRNNRAISGWSGAGGAIYFSFQSDTLLFRNCDFIGNEGGWGGALHFASGRPETFFDSCRFIGNHAVFGGAVADVHNLEGARFQACVFDSNRADSSGGALYMFSNPLDRCVITRNSAASGGGLYIPESLCFPPGVTRCTLVGNTASAQGSGIFLGGPAHVRSCIVAFNEGAEGIHVWPQGEPVPGTISYNLVFGNAGGDFSFNEEGFGAVVTTNINGDSCDAYFNLTLAPQFVDTAAGDYHLLSTSPCIDAGPDSSFTFPFRDPDGTVADIGAFYYDQTQSADEERTAVQRYELMQNYPNPFNAATEIRFDLPASVRASLTVYDVLGREVAVLVNETMSAGAHVVLFDGTNLPSGVYLCRLQAGDRTQVRKMLLLK